MQGTRRQIGLWIVTALFLAACGTSPPRVTPTVAPTDTPDPTLIAQEASETPTIAIQVVETSTATVTPSPRPTNTPVPTETATLTLTPSHTPTGTQTPTSTPSNTPTPTPTATFTPTPTPTETEPPTLTPLAIEADTDTPEPTSTATASLTPRPSQTNTATAIPPTATDAPTATPTNTDTPEPSSTPVPSPTRTNTATITPDVVATANAELLATRSAASDTPQPATFTPVAIPTETNTVIPATLDAEPEFVTAEPNSGILPTPEVLFTPVQSTPVIEPDAPTVTVTQDTFFTPTPFPVEQIPPTVSVEERETVPILAPAFNNTTTTALNFNVGDGQFIFNGETLLRGVNLFAVNPADPNSYATTNQAGFLVFRPIGGEEQVVTTSPFFAGFTAESAGGNKNFISALAWSPNGQRLAFIITPGANQDDFQNAGVWFWDSGGGTGVLLSDCAQPFHSSCQSTSNPPAGTWQSTQIEWSPDSSRVLITAVLNQGERQGIFVATLNYDSSRPTAPPMLLWDNGQWLDNNTLLVSGRAPDGRSQIARYDIGSNTVTEIIYDATANGVFIADAVQRPNGQIIAVGREGGAFDGAYRLYRIADGVATPISDFIGGGVPSEITWGANYANVVLTVGGAQFIVNANGSFSVAQTSGTVQVGASVVNNPDGTSQVAQPPPTGVIAGTRYEAGQQIQYIGVERRNMRSQPSLAAGFVDTVSPGEFVTILAGPAEADNFQWWQVSNANGTRAWISVRTIDGSVSYFTP
ncbi:MAG: SH3 domain-containing protein [Chloroflexota bacterium]